MKVFVSWSGAYSRSIAELLRDWIPNVIQEATLYVSSQDIAKGESWPDNIRNNLSEIDIGIVVVTKSNFEAPWILFEAGALSKSVKSRVIPLLCDVEHIDLAKSPLRLLQSAQVNEADMQSLLKSLNSFSDNPLSDERVSRAFDKWWPEFQDAYAELAPDFRAANSHSADDPVTDALEAILTDLATIKADIRRRPKHDPVAAALARSDPKYTSKNWSDWVLSKASLDRSLSVLSDDELKAIIMRRDDPNGRSPEQKDEN